VEARPGALFAAPAAWFAWKGKQTQKRAKKSRFAIAAMEKARFLRVSFDIFQDYLI
jgi:hypothetical protein